MAINRDIAYYLNFKNNRGWDMRLQIIPAGNAISPAELTWRELKSVVVKIGNAKFDFEDVPIGIMKAPTLSIDFDMTLSTDTNLSELLLNPHYDYTLTYPSLPPTLIRGSTIFTLATNYGSGEVDRFVFVGCQSIELGNELTLDANHQLKEITANLIDIMKFILENTKVSLYCEYIVKNVSWNFLLSGSEKPFYAFYFPSISDGLVVYSLQHKMNYTVAGNQTIQRKYYGVRNIFGGDGENALGVFLEKIVNVLLRRNSPGFSKSLIHTNNLFRAMTFYHQTHEEGFNVRGAVLSHEAINILGEVRITDNSNSEVTYAGLFYKDKSNESFREYEYLHELISVIAENFCVKFKWFMINTPFIDNTTDGYYVPIIQMGWFRPFESTLTTSYNDVSNIKIVEEKMYKAETVSNVYRSSECEFPNLSGNNTSNVSEEQTGLQNQETWNVKLCLYSIPTLSENRTYVRQMVYVNGLYNILLLPHGDTDINDGYHSVYAHRDGVPLPLPTQYGEYQFEIPDSNGWVIETQRQNTMANCINGWFIKTFSSTSITKRTFTLEFDGTILSPWSIGDGFILPPIINSTANTDNILMSMDIDWLKGTAECEFVSISE